MKNQFLSSEMLQELRNAANDQEISTSLSFDTPEAAQRFASMANQVVFDTTLNLDPDETSEVTKKIRSNMAQQIPNLHIEAVGTRVNARLSPEVIECLNNWGTDLGLQAIKSGEVLESWSEDWVVPRH